MKVRWLWVVLLCVDIAAGSNLVDWLEHQYEAVRIGLVSGLKRSSGAGARRRAAQQRPTRRRTPSMASVISKFQDVVPEDVMFPCDTKGPGARSSTRPTSVHRLRPGDIDVIGAMGDSLTAASGVTAERLADILVENRGMSWSIGGQFSWHKFLTLPNILREFNPNLIGFSLKDTLGFQQPAQFNVAEPLAISSDMPFQARLLVRRMRADKRVDFENDWKMVTVMIGSNDFCSFMCYYKNISVVPEMHRKNLEKALDWLRDNLPRTIVNLAPPPHLRVIQEFKGKPISCFYVHKVECPCLFGERWRNRKEEFSSIMQAVQLVDMELASSSRYSGREDFTVVAQPFLLYSGIPRRNDTDGNEVTDFSFLSEDCFHFSQKLQAAAANSLWNNLMEPIGNKSQVGVRLPFDRFLCPTEEHPYIYTALNS